MPEKKEEKPNSIKFWPGLKRDIKAYAQANGIPFSTAVNHLLDRGLYQASYKFPFHKPEFSTNNAENEDNDDS